MDLCAGALRCQALDHMAWARRLQPVVHGLYSILLLVMNSEVSLLLQQSSLCASLDFLLAFLLAELVTCGLRDSFAALRPANL